MPLTPGTLVGPYEILGQIGVGGMGEVYRAKETGLHRDVAIKVLPGEMREHYILIQRNTTITGRATYTRFRQFTVTTTEKPRPQ